MRRYSIGFIMAAIAVAAIGLAAIRHCSPLWAGVVLSTMFFLLACSLLGVIFGRNRRRVYWSGFALLGWTYVLLTLHENINAGLLAPSLINFLEQVLHPEAVGNPGMQSLPAHMLGAAATGGGFGGAPAVVMMDFEPCRRTAMAIEAMVWAVLGGYVALYFAARQDGAQQS